MQTNWLQNMFANQQPGSPGWWLGIRLGLISSKDAPMSSMPYWMRPIEAHGTGVPATPQPLGADAPTMGMGPTVLGANRQPIQTQRSATYLPAYSPQKTQLAPGFRAGTSKSRATYQRPVPEAPAPAPAPVQPMWGHRFTGRYNPQSGFPVYERLGAYAGP